MNCFVILLIIALTCSKVSADYMQDSWEESNVWEEPNAWGRDALPDSGPSVCPVCDVAEDGGLAAFCYKKLVSNLFNKNTLKKNEYTEQLERTILFTVSAAQLEIIEKSTDMRDLDTVITEILKSAKSVTGGAAKDSGSLSWLFSDIMTDSFQMFTLLWSNSEFRFICFILGIMMLIWFIHKRYNKNLIAVVAVGFFLFGYFFTYLECNRKLEADKFIAYVKENEDLQSGGWFKRMFDSLFKKSKDDEQIRKIQAESKIQLPFCRPDTVLTMYVYEMFLNQLELVISKCISISVTFKDGLSFPYNIIAMVAVPCLFVFFIKLIFKYIINPSVWFNVFRSTNSSGANQPQQQQLQNNSHEDRITGPNLQLLLQAFAKRNTQTEALPSGVEEILECIENGSADRKSDESKSEDDAENSINLDKISQEKVKKES